MMMGGFLLPMILIGCATSRVESALQEFVELVRRGAKDEECLRALKELDAHVLDSDLDEVESFALRDKSLPAGFAFVRLLVERNRFGGAARVSIKAVRGCDHPDYVLWKWWDFTFGEHPRSKELGMRFVDAILEEFERGDAPKRLLIAQLFKLGEAESRLSVSEFKRAIGYSR